MRVQERLSARVLVDQALLHGPGGRESVSAQLRKQLIATADERAWKVRPESVYIWQGRNDEATFQAELLATWSPRNARLVGGEYDGDTIDVDRQAEWDGYPAERITMPYRAAPSPGSNASPVHHPEYVRDGIDPIEDVWVYTIR